MSYSPGSMLKRFLELRGWRLVKFSSNSMVWGPSYEGFCDLGCESFVFSFKNSYFLSSWGFLRLLVRIYMKFPIDSYP